MRIHLLGIGGTGMGSLAGLLAEAGHAVTGTDLKLYPPMSDQLADLGVTPLEGYRAENISSIKPELVIIGNVIRSNNPEAQEVMRLGIPYRSMPAALSDLFLCNRTPMVISGTHGKTTTSTLAAWLLDSAGEDPGFLIGGVGQNFGRSYKIGRGHFFVIEGDEYDTAFFDKGPKFLHYRPQALLITSIEFDHADIYKDLAGILTSFSRLVSILPPDGIIVANADDANVMGIIHSSPCRVVTYGLKSGDWLPSKVTTESQGTSFELQKAGSRFLAPLWGNHNLANVVGVLAMLIESGMSSEKLKAGLATFKGVKRRQELVSGEKGIYIIDDFAHHPTAVAKTIESMRMRFPKQRLWAIFEPRSNTSRRNIFRDDFIHALKSADRVIIASPFRAETIDPSERFDSLSVAAAITKLGTDAHHIPNTDNIIEFVIRGVEAGDVILIMSNGSFDGLPTRLAEAVSRRHIYSDNDTIPRSRVLR